MGDMRVELLDHMGSDLDVVDAARVSFHKESLWADDENYLLSDKDAKLIHYLATNEHWTPFSHCYARFRIKAPLFVRSQLFKHKIGLTENEVSRRYVDSEPEFYVPEYWRKRAENVKQGSSDEVVETVAITQPSVMSVTTDYFAKMVTQAAVDAYHQLLDAGVCPEQARMVLPQSMMTEWIWSGSLAAFARVVKQRTSEHAQVETKHVAMQIGEELEPLFPVSWRALTR